jgi:alkylation response protein AidB-like acyl-CoA dehydrogenase
LISNAFAGALIERGGSDEQKARWLPGIASGRERGAAAFTTDEEPVVGAAAGAAVLVLNDGDGARLVEPADARLERLDLIDTTRAYFRASADGGDPLPGDVSDAVDIGVVALAAELVGVAQRALDMAVDYAKVREQFGQPIGSFQAIRHKCAEMLLEVENSFSAVYYAAWSLEHGAEDGPLSASVAKAYVNDASRKVCGDAIQVHGGIGFTWEYDLHLYFKRAKALEPLYGDADYHRELIVRRVAR